MPKSTTIQGDLTKALKPLLHGKKYQDFMRQRREAGLAPLAFADFVRTVRRSIIQQGWDKIKDYLNGKQKRIEGQRQNTPDIDIALWDWRWYVHQQQGCVHVKPSCRAVA